MKYSISNIAWTKENDEKMYSIIKECNFSGLEIAPTRLFENPYSHLEEAELWSNYIKEKYNIEISSMQSIWFGKTEKIFASKEDRNELIEYTKKAIDFASTIGCKNLVFGCPKNRSIDKEYSENIAINFFKEIGDYACRKNICISLEANPVIYGTDYINDTKSAIELIKKVDSSGFKLNLDVGTIIYNNESLQELEGNVSLINHVHISEPNLKKIEHRTLHKDLFELLKTNNYDKYVSIEMGNICLLEEIEETMKYLIDLNKDVPNYIKNEYSNKTKDYVLLIPIINEGTRIINELQRAVDNKVHDVVDIVICDGDSKDGCTKNLERYNVNALLVKKDKGKQGAQLRMGFDWAIKRGYKGIITIDGNNKDSIEDTFKFVEKLQEGYDFIQGSRFIKGGKAINTPISRWLAVRLLHAPIISITAGHHFTDTTNNFRGYSIRYLTDERVNVFRDCFSGYELLAYLSSRASQLGYKVCEIPVSRVYPKNGKTPTKISPLKGNIYLLKILINNLTGKYNAKDV